MRKRWLSLLLALVMLASVTVTTASADTVNLSDKTVTLSVTPSQSAVCVGSTGPMRPSRPSSSAYPLRMLSWRRKCKRKIPTGITGLTPPN